MPFLGVMSELIGRGVEVRLIHAKEPGPNFREDFDRYPRLAKQLERAMCPRVHFKLIIIDQTMCYVGSANLTGAGIGMKSSEKRNFEAGILTDDPQIVEQAMKQFDDVWTGRHCQSCRAATSARPDCIIFIEKHLFPKPLPRFGRGTTYLCHKLLKQLHKLW